MRRWLLITLVAASVGILIVLSFLFRRVFCRRRRANLVDDHENQERVHHHHRSLQTGIARLHQVSNIHASDLDQDSPTNNKRANYVVLRRGVPSSSKTLFSWADNPSLVTDAVENGWSRFVFSPFVSSSSPSVRSARSLLGACAAGDQAVRELMEVETSWEVCQGSADFVQIIRLNSGLKRTNSNANSNFMGAVSVIKAALPLPGPPLENSSFPQEAYFEVTILSPPDHQHKVDQELMGKVKEDKVDGEKIKLIKEDYNAKTNNSESLVHVSSTHSYGSISVGEKRHAKKESGKNEHSVFSVGLTLGGSLPMKLPGSYPGSIGFISNGSVFLDGIKLASESEKQGWGIPDKVIGCGYNPSKKKVFFTVDSQLVHEVHCKTEAYSTPLFPTLAANADITVLVNLGQCVFKYAPANLQRTPNPCFMAPLANSPSLGFDSGELFSIGRVNSHHQWLNRTANKSTASNGTVSKGQDYDEESEGDLFEITLDSSGRSPYTKQ